MTGRILLSLWLSIFCLMTFESFRLNHNQSGIYSFLQKKNIIPKEFSLSPDPGKPISLYYGWIGFSVILMTNFYILRKKMNSMKNWGRLKNWLNFHIFCGLLGPTFIIFHSNFKVRGLVAISFWSMIISVLSGLVGRYFYLQLSKVEMELKIEADKALQKLKKLIQKKKLLISENQLIQYLNSALKLSGYNENNSSLLTILFSSLIGDIKLLFQEPQTPSGAGPIWTFAIKIYAVNHRKINTIDSFKKMMSYWHAFHMPFAVFMYIAAVLHIMAAFILKVS